MSQELFHFLILDDNKLDCFIAEKVIANTHRSVSIHVFNFGHEALNFLKTTELDPNYRVVLVVDIYMPVINGFEFLKSVLDVIPEQRKGNYVFSFFTSSISEVDVEEAKKISMDIKFHTKPITSATFNAFLDEIQCFS